MIILTTNREHSKIPQQLKLADDDKDNGDNGDHESDSNEEMYDNLYKGDRGGFDDYEDQD